MVSGASLPKEHTQKMSTSVTFVSTDDPSVVCLSSPVATVGGLPTWSEVHVVLVVAALQGVEGSCDLAGELLTAVHALALQMVPQIGDVVFVSSEEANI